MPPYRQLLVPVDGSPTSRKALDEAIRLARAGGGRIRVMHVMDAFLWANGYETPRTLLEEVLPHMREAGEKLLAAECGHVSQAGIACDSVLIDSSPARLWELVVQQAGRWGADLIVVGSHGRRGVERALLGSDAEQIARHAPVPVLIVRG